MGKTTTYTYTALGKVESVVDSLNNRQEFTYDSMGRNTVVRDALNNTSTAEYDKLGNVTKLVGPLGGATNYSYDEMGRFISESTSSGGTITYGYNALNIKEQLTNAKGQVRTVATEGLFCVLTNFTLNSRAVGVNLPLFYCF